MFKAHYLLAYQLVALVLGITNISLQVSAFPLAPPKVAQPQPLDHGAGSSNTRTTATTITQAEATLHLPELYSWLQTKGYEGDRVSPHMFDGGLRGMVAMKDIGRGDVVMEIPWGACLIMRDSDPCPNTTEPPYSQCKIDPRVWDAMTKKDRLIVRLMQEYMLGERSVYWEFLKVSR